MSKSCHIVQVVSLSDGGMKLEEKDWTTLVILIVFFLLAIFVMFQHVIVPWWSQNWWIIAIVIGVIVGGFVFFIWLGGGEWKKSGIKKAPRYYTPSSAPQRTVDEIIDALEDWTPSKKFRDESYAEVGTVEYLKHYFPDLKFQQYHEGFRADLEIEDVGIEIKLPKRSRHLTTLRGQIMQYCKYFDYVIALIFDYKYIPRETLESFIGDMKDHYSDKVTVIIKD